MIMDIDKLLRAISRLGALRENISNLTDINEKYVKEYQEVIDSIEKALNIDLTEFEVPNSEVVRRITSWDPENGSNYSDDRWCDTAYILTKVDGLKAYLNNILSREEKKIGFEDRK
jgi:hypothetical protein